VVIIDLTMYALIALVMGSLLLKSLKEYDPDKVDSMVDNKLTYLWMLKRYMKQSN
jgi:hypothetical protein